MDSAARAAFVNAQAACAMAEIAAMQASNMVDLIGGLYPRYSRADFMAVQDKYVIGHNAVIEYLRG